MDRILQCMSAPGRGKHLDLSSLGLEDLPPGLADILPNLETLNLSGCDLAFLPESLGKLSSLRSIDLTGNFDMRELPASLDLSTMEVKTLQTHIVALHRIRPPLMMHDSDAAERLQVQLRSLKNKWAVCQQAIKNGQGEWRQAKRVIDELGLHASTTAGRGVEESDLVKRNWENAARIVERWCEHGLERLQPEHLLELNEVLGAMSTQQEHYGRFRTSVAGRITAEREGKGYYVPSPVMAAELDNLLEWLHQQDRNLHDDDLLGQLALAAAAYKNLVSIHPFRDGNGRTCRLVMNWMLLRRGLPITIVPGPRAQQMLNPAIFLDDIDVGDRTAPDMQRMLEEAIDGMRIVVSKCRSALWGGLSSDN